MFTSGIVSTGEGQKIALFFTGRQHAGENLAEVLKQRAAELPRPIQMCDALSRNVPKLPGGVEILLALCLAHGRRQFLELQLAEKRTEPNSGLGKAITYLLRHWKELTLFLREADAPIDNNIVTAARGSDQIMPTAGLCRVDGFPNLPAFSLMVADAA